MKETQAAAEFVGMVERKTPCAPCSIRRERWGIAPERRIGFSTRKVAPSRPMITICGRLLGDKWFFLLRLVPDPAEMLHRFCSHNTPPTWPLWYLFLAFSLFAHSM
jgi:hypothetical protein